MSESKFGIHIGRYIFSGVLTIIPLWVTWIVFEFLFRVLSRFGKPWVLWISNNLAGWSPELASWLEQPWVNQVLAVVITLVSLYLLGWFATRLIGRRLIGVVESVLNRVPFVQKVYGGVKKLVSVMQQKPEDVQRVVLIEFPSPDMKTVGFVTRVMTEPETGKKLAIVYVPTTPNPTSGYMEIVPLEKVVPTDWTLDEAMNFIISAGAVAPDRIYYSTKAELEKKVT